MSETIHERVESAEQTIKELCARYPEIFWRVVPSGIAVMGITNKDRKEKSKVLSKVIPVKGVQKSLNIIYHVPINYIVEVYWSDWNIWSVNYKEWVLAKALLAISEDVGKLIKADCTDYRLLLDVIGVDWEKRDDLPSLTMGEPVKFNNDLRPGMDDYDEDDEETDEIEDKDDVEVGEDDTNVDTVEDTDTTEGDDAKAE